MHYIKTAVVSLVIVTCAIAIISVLDPKPLKSKQTWAIVELYGALVAGEISTQQIGTQEYLAVFIPGVEGAPDVTRLYNPHTVAVITPVTREAALAIIKETGASEVRLKRSKDEKISRSRATRGLLHPVQVGALPAGWPTL